MLQRKLVNRRRSFLLPATGWTWRLGIYGDNIVLARLYSFNDRQREGWRSHENYVHPLTMVTVFAVHMVMVMIMVECSGFLKFNQLTGYHVALDA